MSESARHEQVGTNERVGTNGRVGTNERVGSICAILLKIYDLAEISKNGQARSV